jgi:hypothetical protein
MDKKLVLGLSALVVLGILGVAQYGSPELVTGMVGAKMAGTGGCGFILGWIIIKLISLAVVTFMVSVIFWYAKKLVLGKK